MEVILSGWEQVTIDGRVYNHDVVIEAGVVAKRDKRTSKPLKGAFGHTPLTPTENIPWGGKALIIGTGQSGPQGMLPIVPEFYEEARRCGIEVQTMKTKDACALLSTLPDSEIYAVLHTTC